VEVLVVVVVISTLLVVVDHYTRQLQGGSARDARIPSPGGKKTRVEGEAESGPPGGDDDGGDDSDSDSNESGDDSDGGPTQAPPQAHPHAHTHTHTHTRTPAHLHTCISTVLCTDQLRSGDRSELSELEQATWMSAQKAHALKELKRLQATLLTTHYSPLTTHHSSLTPHHSQLTTHHSLLTTHYSLLTTHYALQLTHLLCPYRTVTYRKQMTTEKTHHEHRPTKRPSINVGK
jgi:hypothetical protein